MTSQNSSVKDKFNQYKKSYGSILEFIEDFVTEFSAMSTRRAYKKDLLLFIDFVEQGENQISHPQNIRDYHFKVYRDSMIEQGKSSATINRRLVSIRVFIKWCLGRKYIEVNPIESIKLPKIQTQKPTQAFLDEEVTQMIEAPDLSTFRGAIQRMSFVLLFHLGLRRSELTSIRLRDIRQERRNTTLAIHGKGSKTRYVPLTAFVQEEIKNYEKILLNFDVKLGSDDYLLQTKAQVKNLKPIDGATIYRWVKKFTTLLGITRDLSPHSCRATAISHLLDTRQVPIRDVAIFAGHENVNTTERYDKRRDNLDRNAAYEVSYDDEADSSKN